MKIYMAGASKEVDECAAAVLAIRQMGHEITLDWTKPVLEHRALGKDANADVSPVDRMFHARADLDAVAAADVVWIRVPKAVTRGAWTELGAAIILKKQIVVSGDDGHCLFTSLANVFCKTHEDALEYFRTV